MDKLIVEHLSLTYSDGSESLRDINLRIQANAITVLFGPAGGGKSTLLRVFNRLNDLADVTSVSGRVLLNDQNILDPKTDVIALRRKVGIVFSRPIPLPLSIYGNVSYGLEMAGERVPARLDEDVENALRQAVLWDEVKDRLKDPAASLSGGQQQRLCIARTIVVQPEVILMDEPCSALDPIATLKIEELIDELKEQYTVIIVTHNMQQAARVSDYTAFFYLGEMVECGTTKKIFTTPEQRQTEDYITGRFG